MTYYYIHREEDRMGTYYIRTESDEYNETLMKSTEENLRLLAEDLPETPKSTGTGDQL